MICNWKPRYNRAWRYMTWWFGGDNGDRTHDLCIANAALSQLSYIPTGVKTHRQNDALNYK